MTTERSEHGTDKAHLEAMMLRKDLNLLSINGTAARFRGIIVNPSVMQVLREQKDAEIVDKMGVTGTEGHRRIHYSWYVLEDPSLPAGYSLVHHTKEAYEANILGRIPEVIDAEHRSAYIARSGITLTELSKFKGVVQAQYRGGSNYFYQVDFDQIMGVVREASIADKNILSALEENFNPSFLTNNAPEAEWQGGITFYPSGKRKEVSYNFQHDFIYRPELIGKYMKEQSRGPWVGAMFIQSDRSLSDVLVEGGDSGPFRIVGIVKDGYGNHRPYVLPGSEQTDPMEFAKFAIKHFLPEEIFIGTGLMNKSELEEIQALPVHEFWGSHYDSEAAGQIEESWNGHPDNPEYFWTARLVDSRTNFWGFDLAKAKGKETGELVRAEYFPADWKGWPETRRDRATARFASTL